jgi:FtsP/CotA-like multicopper oxidase with cupredoxin domain
MGSKAAHMNGRPIGRRQALALLGVGAATAAAGTAGWMLATSADRSSVAESGQPLRQPAVIDSRAGVLDLTLVAGTDAGLAGYASGALGYNGASPGPTLAVSPGDLMRIRLVNHIQAPTNLHTHGLHVSPEGNGDNPFVMVSPGDSFDYAIRLPRDHSAGTYWYHPHHHGMVADQIFAGLAGALVVRDTNPVPVTDDLVLIITDTTLDGRGRVVAANPMQRLTGREGDLVLVNGQHQPVLAAAQGAVQRWRIVNACVSRVLALRLEAQEPAVIAIDGHYLSAPTRLSPLVLAPGNRADLLVHPTEAGRFRLICDSYDRGGMGMMGGRRRSGAITLAHLAVSGRLNDAPAVPATLPSTSAPDGPAVRQREVVFAMSMGGMARAAFTIDGRSFDPNRDDQAVRLGTVEEWTIINTSPMDHPFHLHVWPFRVLASSTGTAAESFARDVVLVPRNGWVRLRIPFIDFAGRSVYHCHILDHEDLGMMATVRVST